MNAPTSRILGRDRELSAVSHFLDRIGSGPCGLVLDGSAGIGKTTLWLAGVAEAAERGYRVIKSLAAESEARLSYAALGDLLGDVPDNAMDEMPAPLRRALDAALAPTVRPDGAPDPRALSLAAGNVFRRIAEDQPLVIAIDDIQWLDRPSLRVLSFVLRRLSAEPIGVLVSV